MALQFQGSAHFRFRLVFATLSGRSVRIRNIRAGSVDAPGLADFEASFLRLLEKVVSGCVVEISETGTDVFYKPGIITGGRNITHDCGKSRGIGYFLEALVMLAPFAKQAFTRVTLNGITNERIDNSVDVIRTVVLPYLRHFGIEDGVELKIVKRGAPPAGGGQVQFTCPIVKKLTAVDITDLGKVKRIRGIAYSMRVSPQMANRLVDGSRAILSAFTPDVFIYTDHYKGPESGLSPGYGLALVAESTSGCLVSAEGQGEAGGDPDAIGRSVANAMLAELLQRGCVDLAACPLVLMLMCLSEDTISKVRIGKLNDCIIAVLRMLKEFFQVTFKVQPDEDTKTILLSCLGNGMKNMAKRIQ